jgi:hypothetical protein
MYKKRLKFFTLFALLASPLVLQSDSIKSNGQLVYSETQKSVDSFKEMFQEGTFHARLRNNNFYFSYKKDDSSHETQLVSAIGASMVYNSALLNGFDFTLGLYGSKSFFQKSQLDSISHLKASKDTLSRFKYTNGGATTLYTTAQANLSYTYSQTNYKVGRQLVETFYTKSNDTKMIPNSFDGFVVHSKDISDSEFTFAYLAKQKLRDHEESHGILVVGDSNSAPNVNNPQWTENDDSAMHKGLTYTALKAAGKPTDAPLIVLDAQNNSIKNLKINFSSYLVPELLSQVMGELNYKVNFNGFSITPAVRYIQQFDNGAGAVGGASLGGLADSSVYKDPLSLNAKMIAARVVAKVDEYKINLAYTNILNQADLVTPWRGFPTSGYTRSMGMYNWKANTKSYRLEVVKGANSTGVYTSPFIQTSILYIDGDIKKSILAKSMFYYAGIVQNIPSMKEFQYRLRLGYRDFIGDSSSVPNYLDSRLEFNYLF